MRTKIFIFLFVLCSSLSWAQKSKQQELEERKERILNAIAEFNGLLRIEKNICFN